MSWPGQGEQNWGRPGSYGGGDNPYPLPGQGQATPKNGSAPSVQLSSPVRVVRGGITGYHVTATVTLNGTRGLCDPPRAVVHSVAFPSTEGDPVVFITVADRGVPLEQNDEIISRTISSIRPLR